MQTSALTVSAECTYIIYMAGGSSQTIVVIWANPTKYCWHTRLGRGKAFFYHMSWGRLMAKNRNEWFPGRTPQKGWGICLNNSVCYLKERCQISRLWYSTIDYCGNWCWFELKRKVQVVALLSCQKVTQESDTFNILQ